MADSDAYLCLVSIRGLPTEFESGELAAAAASGDGGTGRAGGMERKGGREQRERVAIDRGSGTGWGSVGPRRGSKAWLSWAMENAWKVDEEMVP